jgi:hypothetical protein
MIKSFISKAEGMMAGLAMASSAYRAEVIK